MQKLKSQRWEQSQALHRHPIRQTLQIEYPTRTAARQRAGELLNAVLDDDRQINFCLSYWPTLSHSERDESLEVAYQMLWHFECDAGLNEDGPHKTDAFYADVQFEALKYAAESLSRAEDLPSDLLTMYRLHEPAPLHRPRYYLPWKDILVLRLLHAVMRFYNKVDAIVTPWLAPLLPQETVQMIYKWLKEALHLEAKKPPLVDVAQRPVYPKVNQASAGKAASSPERQGVTVPKAPGAARQQGFASTPQFPASRPSTSKKFLD